MKFLLAHISALFILLPALAWAQPEWEEISPLPGHDVGSITRIISEESGIWTTVSDHPGPNPYYYFRPYYSYNYGDTWELRDNGIPNEVGVVDVQANPHDPNRVLASINNAAISAPYISLNRGITWQQATEGITLPNGVGCQAGWFADGAHAWCYVYGYSGPSYYFYSADSAATWSGYSYLAGLIKLMTLDDLQGYILESYVPGLNLSADYGIVWNQWYFPDFSDYYFGGVGPIGSTPGTIYASAVYHLRETMSFCTYPVISEDTAWTWQFLNPADTLRWTDTRNCDILVDPYRAGHLFYTIVDTIYESTDNGQSWMPIGGGPIGEYFKNIIGYDPHHDCIYATGAYPYSEGPSMRGILRLRRGTAVGDRPLQIMSNEVICIYPIPVSIGGSLNVEVRAPSEPENNVTLYDILGRTVWTSHFPSPTHIGNIVSFHFTVPVLPQGSYFLQCQSAQSIASKRIVILR